MSPLLGVNLEEEEIRARHAPPGSSRRRWLAVAAAVAGAALLGFIVFQGVAGLEGRSHPRAEGFMDAVKPEYRPDEYAEVVEVYDGDTVKLGDGRHVRFLGIDTPETAKPYLGDPVGDPFADEATALTREMVLGRKVGLIYGPERTDHYGRTLASLVVDGVCVNAELLRRGLARAYILDKAFEFKKWFLKAQEEARESRLGIWSLRER